MEAAASAPAVEEFEAEPAAWQPRAIWLGGRLLCGSISFFFASLLFAFFYLKSIDASHAWKAGPVHPASGLGLAVGLLFLIGAVAYRWTATRARASAVLGGAIALVLSLVAIALQFYEYTVLDFGASSGGYASVFFGWTSMYAVLALIGLYWIEIQVASLLRVRREGTTATTEVPTSEARLLEAGLESSSFYWAYFVAIGVLAYIVLYLV